MNIHHPSPVLNMGRTEIQGFLDLPPTDIGGQLPLPLKEAGEEEKSSGQEDLDGPRSE